MGVSAVRVGDILQQVSRCICIAVLNLSADGIGDLRYVVGGVVIKMESSANRIEYVTDLDSSANHRGLIAIGIDDGIQDFDWPKRGKLPLELELCAILP